MATVVYSIALAVAIAWMRLRGDSWQRLGSVEVSFLVSSGAGAGIGIFVVILDRISQLYFYWARSLENEFVKLLGPLRITQIVCLAVVSSVAEEVFFRGALQPSLGLVVTSILFGLLHFGPRSVFIPWTIMAIAMGFALGLLADWSGGLLASVICHFTINALNLAFISVKARKMPLSARIS